MNDPARARNGRALVIAELIRTHGPHRATELVRKVDAEHRLINPGGCEHTGCPVCKKKDCSRWNLPIEGVEVNGNPVKWT